MIRTPQSTLVRSLARGISSDSGGIDPGTMHFIANRLRAYFAPASTLPPPGIARGMTGNRNVTVTSQQSPNSAPTASAIIQLKPASGAARAQWKFPQTFSKQPTITATPIQLNPNGIASEISIQGQLRQTANGVTIQSSDPNDTRFVHVQAIQGT